jgi:predicted alpha/beta hydrolase family esterase
MSSKIYFSDKGKNVSRYLVRVVTDIYRWVFPKHAKKQLRRLLLSPHKREPDPIPEFIATERITTDHGEIQCYTTGKGPVVLFVHGWSGAGSQFFDLMQMIADLGCQAITFDHYKHGRSTGSENNYLLFLSAISVVEAKYLKNNSPLFVVSHSMGSATTVDHFKDKNIPLFLIAPLFDFYQELEDRVMGVGVSKAFFEEIVDAVESDYQASVRNRKPFEYIQAINETISIVHSKNDKFAPYEMSERIATQKENVQLTTHEDIGHMRIVSSPITQKALKDFCEGLKVKTKVRSPQPEIIH